MFYFLLAVQHLPAFDAEYLSITLRLYLVEFVDERRPFSRVPFNHYADTGKKIL